MNRRFFLKLLPAASAAVALPSTAPASSLPAKPDLIPTYQNLQGDGYYEVIDGDRRRVMTVTRWRMFDCPTEGECYRFRPYTASPDGIQYRYAAEMDAAIVRKVGEF